MAPPPPSLSQNLGITALSRRPQPPSYHLSSVAGLPHFPSHALRDISKTSDLLLPCAPATSFFPRRLATARSWGGINHRTNSPRVNAVSCKSLPVPQPNSRHLRGYSVSQETSSSLVAPLITLSAHP
ncbi:hypothetical protein Nepgr_005089 [Nepenthes gracilis]|uniref:Uncharacterized protein n=1 Tax=Nepenthes gracilis TaxID=150966 RepID=A0AAD3S2I4_NEPGR|nr:hypothetical protein Nepgr_005089 [Nepenthes gracilis]